MRVSGGMNDNLVVGRRTAQGELDEATEKGRAIEMARAVLRAPHIDPYSEVALLARQTLRALGVVERG